MKYEIYQQNKQINLIKQNKQQKLIFYKKYNMIYNENLMINVAYYYTKTYTKYVKYTIKSWCMSINTTNITWINCININKFWFSLVKIHYNLCECNSKYPCTSICNSEINISIQMACAALLTTPIKISNSIISVAVTTILILSLIYKNNTK
eukprot:390564_1